ncbi:MULTISPECIES: phage portal protein [Sphingomonas]|uniref:phage portal protein n=1 Tax=Sphingomonas TaxID=13687 RepID=UPI00254F6B27|nr:MULTISPECIES: phage portal protein [Sphingomonas]MDK8186714.1 phage portal protein [Sphingomonas zeae]MDK8216379.1 phage portal protein [Sphingomonas sp. UMB7805-LC452B]
MGFGEFLDSAIEPIAPGWARRRLAERAQVIATKAAVGQLRQYDAATRDRRTAGWRRDATSADAESARGRDMLARAGHDLVRNNKYAAGGVRQQVASIWGDGISPQMTHPVKRIAKLAQEDWDRFAESKVDGLGDWYGHGKVAVREMIVGGESLTIWRPDADGPDGRVTGVEGAQLDMNLTRRLDAGGRIVQGVQFNADGDRTGYWLFDDHPGDPIGGSAAARLRPAEHIDHLYERQRFGQTRGVSWLGAVAMTLRDIGDIEDAKRLQEKVQACMGLVIQPSEGQTGSPLGAQALSATNPNGPLEETLRPGLILRLNAGETASTINPTPSSSTVDFIRQQLAGVSANMVPYHLMTGDVSQANYSGLRAAMNGSYAMIDDWQQNEVIPLLCRPAVARRMRRLALQTGDKRFLAVRPTFALPIRRMVDPVKDLMGEIMEIRAGLKLLSTGLAERGINADEHMAAISNMNAIIDNLKLALDIDPRRLTDSGVLQMAAGYLANPAGQPAV